MIAVGLDPGFSNLGFAVVELTADEESLLELGVITTKKSAKKKRLFEADDSVRRMREINSVLARLFWEPRATIICSERQSWGFPNTNTHRTLGFAWGSIVAMSGDIPLIQVPPDDLKAAVTGDNSASKDTVADALGERFVNLEELLRGTTKSKQNHATDALAAIIACLDSELVNALRAVTGR